MDEVEAALSSLEVTLEGGHTDKILVKKKLKIVLEKCLDFSNIFLKDFTALKAIVRIICKWKD